MSRVKQSLILFPIAAVFCLMLAIGVQHTTHAVSGSDWQAGNIIDDSLFYDNSSMSVDDIQNFLNNKVPSCDTQGTQSAADDGYPNMTHAQYAAMQGWPGPPYVCLKDYMQVPTSSQIIDNYSGSTPQGALSAAQIIKNAADSYNISPRVLLTTLQKESLNLIYDNWPMQSQYKNAMGYGCPDTAPCDPSYAGFYNQINNSAWQFNQYRTNSGAYRYKPFQVNSIYYNPNAACGASNVTIQNYATSGLYNYTPYQPNQAALNNLYGSGDSCSAYGNRNFWRIYNDWFGASALANPNLYIVNPLTSSAQKVVKGVPTTLSYTVQNKGTSSIDTGVLWICTSLNGNNYGSGSTRQTTLAPGATMTVSMTYTPSSSGTLTATACGNPPSGPGWVDGYPNQIQPGYRQSAFIVSDTGIIVSTAINAGSATVTAGIPTTLNYTVTNYSNVTLNTGTLWICTALNNTPLGGGGTSATLTPGQSLTVSMQYTPVASGTLILTACGNPPGGPGWVSGYPSRQYYDHGQRTYTVSPSPLVISSPISTATPLQLGVPNTLSFTVKNTSSNSLDTGVLWICTSLNGVPYGSGSTQATLTAGQTVAVNMPYTPASTGQLTVTACGNPPGGPGWVSGYPVASTPSDAQKSFSVSQSPIKVTTSVNAAGPLKAGTPVSLSYTVTNTSSSSLDTGVLWICTALNGNGYGSGSIRTTLAPGATATSSFSYTPSTSGTLTVAACGNPPGGPGWVSGYPAATSNVSTNATYTVSP